MHRSIPSAFYLISHSSRAVPALTSSIKKRTPWLGFIVFPVQSFENRRFRMIIDKSQPITTTPNTPILRVFGAGGQESIILTHRLIFLLRKTPIPINYAHKIGIPILLKLIVRDLKKSAIRQPF
jgi:hypothetical protein